MKIIIFTLLAGLVLICVSRIRFHVEYHRNQQDDRFFVNVALIRGLLNFKTEFTSLDLEKRVLGLSLEVKSEAEAEVGPMEPDINMEKKIPINIKTVQKVFRILKDILVRIRQYKLVILRLLKLTHVRELDWRTGYGTGDPALTGLAVGLVWTIKSNALQLLYRKTQGSLTSTSVQVVPDFYRKAFNVDLRCIFDIKIGHIIIAGFKIMLINLKLLILRMQRGPDNG